MLYTEIEVLIETKLVLEKIVTDVSTSKYNYELMISAKRWIGED